jgi:hypothetical protein
MFRETSMMSAREELLQRHMTREMEFHNSAAGRAMQEQMQLSARDEFLDRRWKMGFLNSVADRAMQEHIRWMNDPMNQMMLRAAQDAATRAKERGLWYYRRTTGIISRASIRKAVNRGLERLFPKKFDPESFAKRIRAVLSVQDNRDGIVKVHSPPLRLIPKTLHPIDSVA